MAKPSFTVVMATYNRGRHILPSVRSVLQQDWREFELLVIGDGCTDDTGAILEAEFGNQLRWINLPSHKGSQSFPNNLGIAEARGDRIAYLGHDDLWAPDHLTRLAELFDKQPGLDVAVSGCAFHLPHGMPGPFITGLFEDPDTPRHQFFPPSSFAHRRDLTSRIGRWNDPFDIRPPVDCDLLLRAVQSGCSFASTRRITVHKFAAGHRYLSYLWHDTEEQEQVLDRLAAPGVEEWLDQLTAESRAAGRFMAMPYADFSDHGPGDLARANLIRKGLQTHALSLTDEQHLRPTTLPYSLDWERNPIDRFFWSAGNPRPRVLLPFCSAKEAVILIDFAHAQPDALRQMEGRANGKPVSFRMSTALPRGTVWMATGIATVPLQEDRPTALELLLHPNQCAKPNGERMGYGRIVALPVPTGEGQAAAERANTEGIAQHGAGDVAAAMESFRAALRASPLHAAARANLALLLGERGEGFDAAEQALIAATLEPTCLAAWIALSRVALASGAAEVALTIATLLDGLPDGIPVAAALREAAATLPGAEAAR
jgi:hypothetical protein